MSTTVQVPKFWTFHFPCSCPYGALAADQSPFAVIVTEEQAWADFDEHEERNRNKAEREGCYVTPVDDYDVERWKAGHSHPECTKPKEASS